MTEVHFYVLQEQSLQHRMLFACRLVSKALKQKREVHLHMSGEESAIAMDELLWSFDASSFIPHCLLHEHQTEPVTIGWGAEPGNHCDTLINMDLQVPGFIGRFDRVGEIVVQEPRCRDALRDSYRYYRERGYPLTNHPIT